MILFMDLKQEYDKQNKSKIDCVSVGDRVSVGFGFYAGRTVVKKQGEFVKLDNGKVVKLKDISFLVKREL